MTDTNSTPAPRRASRLGVAAVALVAVGAPASSVVGMAHHPTLASLGRWVALAGLVLYAWQRRSLTAWILVSMALGAEVGHDWPAVGQAARVLSQIFLRLIKTIIAPLLFATLVVGIAGHSNLRQVGRMGIKALLYFEVVTTIALFLGLAAINLSRAGVGVTPPALLQPAGMTRRRQAAADAILNALPEHRAQAVGDAHVPELIT